MHNSYQDAVLAVPYATVHQLNCCSNLGIRWCVSYTTSGAELMLLLLLLLLLTANYINCTTMQVSIWDLSASVVWGDSKAPVGRVKWRPDHAQQLAVAASTADADVCIFDVSQPYVPVAVSSQLLLLLLLLPPLICYYAKHYLKHTQMSACNCCYCC
jgi:hypothetical protein